MRRLATLVVAVVAVSCAQTVNVEQEKAALMAADAEWLKTAKDIDRYASYFTADGTMALAGMPAMKGPQAVKDNLGPMMKAPGFDVTWTATQADVASSGDLGYTAGTYRLTMNNPAGMPVTETGKYHTTWKKVDGAWKVVYDAGGPDGPTPLLSPPVVTPAAEVKWMDAPPFLPKGAKLAVLIGDPNAPGAFTLRLQLPDGYKIAPHTHPTDEHVTVLSGVLRAGTGNTWDDKALSDYAAGSYANMASTLSHFVQAKGVTVVQLHGVGPFVLNYVNAADDPSKTK